MTKPRLPDPPLSDGEKLQKACRLLDLWRQVKEETDGPRRDKLIEFLRHRTNVMLIDFDND